MRRELKKKTICQVGAQMNNLNDKRTIYSKLSPLKLKKSALGVIISQISRRDKIHNTVPNNLL